MYPMSRSSVSFFRGDAERWSFKISGPPLELNLEDIIHISGAPLGLPLPLPLPPPPPPSIAARRSAGEVELLSPLPPMSD